MTKFTALIGCQNDDCAAEVSYPLDMIRLFRKAPICQGCYDDILIGELSGEEWDDRPPWHGLPRITLKDLCE